MKSMDPGGSMTEHRLLIGVSVWESTVPCILSFECIHGSICNACHIMCTLSKRSARLAESCHELQANYHQIRIPYLLMLTLGDT